MIIITDTLRIPIDEGAKVATFNLLRQLRQQIECIIFSVNGFGTFGFVDFYLKTNKLLFDLTFYRNLKEHKHEKILYIPEASITPASIVRARLLKIFTGKKVTILSLQPRKYNSLLKFIIKAIQPECIITQTNITAKYLKDVGINSKVLSLGVDDTKYKELDNREKKFLRDKYNIDHDKTVLLHVGHICSSRNLDWLLQVKSQMTETEVVIVSSTYNQNEKELYEKLVKNGIKIIREYVANIEEIYNLANYYIFPVFQNDGAIETPLSVLEAMACNLPVITTRFGSLPDFFKENGCFHYVQSSDEIVEILKKPKKEVCDNREKIMPYTWNRVARNLIDPLCRKEEQKI